MLLCGLAACGGGGTDAPPADVSPVTSSVSPAGGSVQVVEGESAPLTFTVTVTGTPSGPVVPVVTGDGVILAATGTVDSPAPNQYTVRLATLPGVEAGTYIGGAVFRLCTDASCSSVHAGTRQLVSYTVDVRLSDWTTFQRNAAHTGYVNKTFDPLRFAMAWSWSRATGDPEPIGGINAVSTGGGKVFVTLDVYFGQGAVYALDEADGSLAWTYALGRMASGGPAAYADNTVYAPSTDPASNCVIWAIDASTGRYRFKMPTACQWSNFFAPTVEGGSVLQTSQAGSVYSFAVADGALQWSMPASASDQTTPAADRRYAYQYGGDASGAALKVFDRATGAAVASIPDPFSSGVAYYSIFSAPVVASSGRVIVFSGNGFSGRAASSSEQFQQRVLVGYDVASRAQAWRSANAYLTHPAVGDGVVYAARNAPASLDALSETDGRLLWSWTLPAGDASFHRNIVLTKNLLFVSTDASVYAVDLLTHKAVWRYPKPGMLAISGGAMLYIATGAVLSDGNLVAIRLN
jgi:outer membrane protein assembly factor BamB